MSHHLDLSISNLLDLNDIAQVADTSINLDLVLEELLEGRDVEDLVGGRLRGVDDELSTIISTPSTIVLDTCRGMNSPCW